MSHTHDPDLAPKPIQVETTRPSDGHVHRRAFTTVTLRPATRMADSGGADGDGTEGTDVDATADESVRVISVHVRHAPGSSGGRRAARNNNSDQIMTAEAEIAVACARELESGGCVIAVGDYNGDLSQRVGGCAGLPDGIEMRRAAPTQPTQFGQPGPVDGAIVLHRAGPAAKDESTLLRCEVVLPQAAT